MGGYVIVCIYYNVNVQHSVGLSTFELPFKYDLNQISLFIDDQYDRQI